MSLKFRDEAERQELVRLHAELYWRARAGEISADELVRQSREMLKAHRARHVALKKAAKVAVTGGNH